MNKTEAIAVARELREHHSALERICKAHRDDWITYKKNFEAYQAGQRHEALNRSLWTLWNAISTIEAQFNIEGKDLGFPQCSICRDYHQSDDRHPCEKGE